jgi:hypothetical protein
VGDKGAHVTRPRIRNPHRREAIVLEQIEQMSGIATVCLRLPHDHRSDLARLANEYGVAEAMHERVKPLGITRRLDSDRDGRPQRSVESLDGVAIMHELLLDHLARGRIENSDLLFSRMQVTSDERHENGLLFGGRVTAPQPNPTNGGRPFS